MTSAENAETAYWLAELQDHFASPRRLVSRAKTQIEQAASIIDGFFIRKPYKHVVDLDRFTGQQVYKVRMTSPLPDEIELLAKESAGHLRDALDHACYAAAVEINGGNPTKTAFPFAKDSAGVKGELGSKRLSDNPVALRPLLESFRPYDGGNKFLWGLNSIRNPSTHRMIVPVGQAMMASISISRGIISGNTQIGYSRWLPATNEIEYMRLGSGSQMAHSVSANFLVVFDGAHALKGQPVVETLTAICAEVDRVVSSIEQETRRVISA